MKAIVKRTTPFLIVTAGVLLILFGVVANRYDRLLESPGDAPLPTSIAGLQLTDFSLGKDAVGEITKLHREAFPLTSGSTGAYGDGREILVWSSGTVNRLSAAKMVSTMRDAIKTGASPFTPVREVMSEGRPIYQLVGLGQQNYYFQSDAYVIWLAVDSAYADQALEELLEFYP